MKTPKSLILLFLLLTSVIPLLQAQITLETTSLDTTTIISGLDTPWEIAWGPDNHLWITERSGLISRWHPGNGSFSTVLDISDVVYEVSEAGLLGMAFHPDFDQTPWVYLVYNYRLPDNSGIRERLVRYHFDGGALINPDTLLNGLSGSGNHNGSRLAFAPDGTLYMTTGDVQNVSLAQDYSSLSGKVLRINSDGSIPSDNPDPESYIWSIGHRNPQGLVFSPDGLLYSSEHGPSNDDELNIIEKDRNYGWPDVQGFCDSPTESEYCSTHNIREPLIAWTPTLAVAGIDYYNHPAIPEWQHSILMGTLKADRLVVMRLSEDGLSVLEEMQYFIDWWGRLRDVCVSPDGRIFLAVSNKDGRGQIRPGDDRIIELKSIAPQKEYCEQVLTWTLCDGDSILLQNKWQTTAGIYRDTIPGVDCDSIRISELSIINRPEFNLPERIILDLTESYTFTGLSGFASYEWNGNPDLNIPDLTIEAGELDLGEHIYVLRVENSSGCVAYDSCIVEIISTNGVQAYGANTIKIYPNPFDGKQLFIEVPWGYEAISLLIYNQLGQVLLSREFFHKGRLVMDLEIAPGMYILETKSISRAERIRLLVK